MHRAGCYCHTSSSPLQDVNGYPLGGIGTDLPGDELFDCGGMYASISLCETSDIKSYIGV